MREARDRDEFTTPVSPPHLRVVQVATDESRSSENVYMDCNSWTPDSRCFVFWRRPSDDGSKKGGLWLCDTGDRFAIQPIVEYERDAAGIEPFRNTREGFCGAALAPDGRHVYALFRKADRLELARIAIGTGERLTIGTAPIPLTIRGCLTISCDSRHLLLGAFLGDGRTEGAPWGAYVFDLERGSHWIIEFGNGFRNMHAQYSKNPVAPYDLLVNGSDGRLSDGSWLTPPDGSWRWQNMPPPFPPGAGCLTHHHVLRDNGTDWRMVPIGNGADLLSGGHNGFVGTGETVFCGVYDLRGGRWRAPIFEVSPVRLPGGRHHPDYWRGQLAPGVPQPVDLSRRLARADSCHIACDRSGRHFVSDTDGYNVGYFSFLWIATRHERPSEPPWLEPRYLLLTRSTYKGQPAHAHPVLSPDGRFVVFQSDFTGRPQVFVATDFDYP